MNQTQTEAILLWVRRHPGCTKTSACRRGGRRYSRSDWDSLGRARAAGLLRVVPITGRVGVRYRCYLTNLGVLAIEGVAQ